MNSWRSNERAAGAPSIRSGDSRTVLPSPKWPRRSCLCPLRVQGKKPWANRRQGAKGSGSSECERRSSSPTERHKVFFSGDTGLTRDFELIGREHGPFALTLLEVGAFHESWGSIHLGPEHALEVFRMLGGGTLLPVHWGTFNLALHAWDEPAETLVTRAGERGLRVITPRLGAAVEPSRIESVTPWCAR